METKITLSVRDLADLLQRSHKYVVSAYECAFPDSRENEELAQEIADAVALLNNIDSMLPSSLAIAGTEEDAHPSVLDVSDIPIEHRLLIAYRLKNSAFELQRTVLNHGIPPLHESYAKLAALLKQ